ncbi:MAG: hypothetical protein JW779_07440 [Candidatus Thorarchaeota archaeon]|nr:hypothetical protein [Candidatus Thorarchaeota archaeon]
MSSENLDGYRIKCPSCGATYWYSTEKINDYGGVECQNCAMQISTDFGVQGYTTARTDQPDAIVPSREVFVPTSEGVKVKCPHCMAQYIYKDNQRGEDGRVHCQNCGKLIDTVGESVLVYETPAKSGNSENGLLICIVILLLLFVPWYIAIPALVCIAAFKGCNSMKEEETKVYRRDTQGPDLR